MAAGASGSAPAMLPPADGRRPRLDRVRWKASSWRGAAGAYRPSAVGGGQAAGWGGTWAAAQQLRAVPGDEMRARRGGCNRCTSAQKQPLGTPPSQHSPSPGARSSVAAAAAAAAAAALLTSGCPSAKRGSCDQLSGLCSPLALGSAKSGGCSSRPPPNQARAAASAAATSGARRGSGGAAAAAAACWPSPPASPAAAAAGAQGMARGPCCAFSWISCSYGTCRDQRSPANGGACWRGWPPPYGWMWSWPARELSSSRCASNSCAQEGQAQTRQGVGSREQRWEGRAPPARQAQPGKMCKGRPAVQPWQ